MSWRAIALVAGFATVWWIDGIPCGHNHSAAAVQGFWYDLPPERFRDTVTVTAVYQDRDVMTRICGAPPIIACHRAGVIYLPAVCSPTAFPMSQRERIDVRRLIVADPTFCGWTKAHEAGHANGWPGDHPA